MQPALSSLALLAGFCVVVFLSMRPLCAATPEPSSIRQTMNKTTATKQPKTEFWPGTNIVKSKNNGFTRTAGPSCMASPAEEAKARKLAHEANTHEKQRAAKKGFGHATLGGLSKRAQAQLKKAPASISIAPRGSSQGGRIQKAGI